MSERRRYDPDLPILDELERAIARAARARLDAEAAAEPAPRRPRPLGGRLRVPRRAAALAALVSLVGATAVAAVSVWDRHGAPADGAVELDAPRLADDARLELHARGERLCLTLYAADAVESVCARPPAGGDALVRGATAPFDRYVFGLTGPLGRTADVRSGSIRGRAPTRPLPAGAKPSAGVRYFVVRLPRGGRDRPATVVVRDSAGRRLSAVVDCAPGQVDRRCLRR